MVSEGCNEVDISLFLSHQVFADCIDLFNLPIGIGEFFRKHAVSAAQQLEGHNNAPVKD